MSVFTPVESTIGGVLLGSSAAGMLLLHSRIAGLSGMIAGLRHTDSGEEWTKNVSFLGGLVGGASAAIALGLGSGASYDHISLPAFAVAGLVMGAGARIGYGCTSGHGLCGLGRMSPRSLVAVASFLSTAMITTTILHRPAGAPLTIVLAPTSLPSDVGALVTRVGALTAVSAGLVAAAVARRLPALSYAGLGGLFGVGLVVSGMNLPAKHTGFLNVLGGAWDPSLACVLGAGVVVSWLSYRAQRRQAKPLLAAKWAFPTSTHFEWGLVVGGGLFGVAWAVGSACPGPVLANIAHSPKPLAWLGALVVGNILAGYIGAAH